MKLKEVCNSGSISPKHCESPSFLTMDRVTLLSSMSEVCGSTALAYREGAQR